MVDGDIDMNGLLSFIQRSQMSLETFQLSSPLANEFQVLSILQEMSQLQSLTLFTAGASQVAFFRALSRKTTQSRRATILPALQTVTLRGKCNVYWTWSPLENRVLRSRFKWS
ncbi:hypothetical protein C8J56DRAFT_1046274 [Mycena floridula]|nr:hypothetical protein C8J56DRAFT_1046274 [Mycena floridula]